MAPGASTLSSSNAEPVPASASVFRPLATLNVRWCQADGHGFEHLTLERLGERISAISVVAFADEDSTFGASYQIFLNVRWRIFE